MDRDTLEGLGREELVVEARRQGVKRPEVMTRVELVDEVLRLGTPNPVERKKVRGWLGIARDLIASAVELGLNLPDAAAMIRGDVRFEPLRPEQPPVATVTLAEIYGAQGHFDRAVGILDEVLEREPDHEVAGRLRARLAAERDAKAARQAAKASLAPVLPDPEELGESFDDNAATLIPMPPDETELADDDSDRATTLVPVRPDGPAHEGEVDLPTLPPIVGPVPESGPPGVDEPELPTLFPSKRAPSEDELDGDEDRPTNPQHVGAVEGVTVEPETHDGGLEEPAVLLARTGAESAQVYFELGRLTDSRGDTLVLRVVEHRPRVAGVERVERDLSVAGARGTATILDLERGSFVRAALGRKWDGQFRAAAVAAEIRVGEGALGVAWAPRTGVNYEAVANRAGLGKTPD